MTRLPPANASMVSACIAVAAGVRAAICTTPVASLMRVVSAARYASGDRASDP
ncbi:unannotated protein [freshwater metagenome]|uniref:Unannotated protein n=1 Tax=freshwater metagenome TaxID=449393 RepID=A0A6J6I5N1_9ZZZZ